MKRIPFSQVLKTAAIDIRREYDRLYGMFCVQKFQDMVGAGSSLKDYCATYFVRLPFRGTCVSLDDFDDFYGYSKELIQLYKEFYLRIVKKTRQVPVNIFTTNYDLYSENALDELGIMYNNGFLGSAQRIFNPNSYNYVVVENLGLSRDVWKSVSNFINLYKIHGSINWLKDDNSGSDTPHILEKDIELIRSRKKYDSIMIYPTPQKDRTTLMVPYSDLFRMMQNSLLKKNSVLISLGYSFGDEHINRIILNALSVYDFRLVIFGDSDMIRKLQEIGDTRIWIINSEDNIHYFNNFVERVLPTQDEEQREEIEIKKSLKKLAVVLGDSSEDPK